MIVAEQARREAILELILLAYLSVGRASCYTEEQIAEEVGLSLGSISEAVKEPSEMDSWQKLKVFSSYQDPKWRPPLYDVWKMTPVQVMLVLTLLVGPINVGRVSCWGR